MGEKLHKPTNEESEKWERAYQKYNKPLYWYAYKMTQNKQDAEDALQATFVKLANHLDKIEDVDSNRAFNCICTILQNSIRDMFRKQSRGLKEMMAVETLHFPTAEELDDVEDVVISKLDFQDVLNCIKEMDEKYRIPFVMRYMQECDLETISQVTNQSKTAIAMQIYRAKLKIKQYIDRRKEG